MQEIISQQGEPDVFRWSTWTAPEFSRYDETTSTQESPSDNPKLNGINNGFLSSRCFGQQWIGIQGFGCGMGPAKSMTQFMQHNQFHKLIWCHRKHLTRLCSRTGTIYFSLKYICGDSPTLEIHLLVGWICPVNTSIKGNCICVVSSYCPTDSIIRGGW
jgi:hypothetical protein